MTNDKLVEKDERTSAVENASYSLGYKVLVFAILLDVAYRSFKLGEASWDLLGLVIFSGFVLTLYQARHRIVSRTWAKIAVLAFVLAFLIAVVLVILRLS